MRQVCGWCGEDKANADASCDQCGASDTGWIYDQSDLAGRRLTPPEGFFKEATDLPDWYRASGWLWVDQDHKNGDGAAAYRVVYKTIRRPIVGQVRIDLPNLKVHVWHGNVRVARPRVEGALPWRKDRHFIVPEWGEVLSLGDEFRFQVSDRRGPNIAFDDEELAGGTFFEAIILVDAEKPEEWMTEGRRKTASLITMIDLAFGPRFLGLRLSEEIGELFPDGHFICSAQSGLLGMESLTTFDPCLSPARCPSGRSQRLAAILPDQPWRLAD